MSPPVIRLKKKGRRILCNPTIRLDRLWGKYVDAARSVGSTFDVADRMQSVPDDRLKDLVRAMQAAGFEVEVEKELLDHIKQTKAHREKTRAEAKTLHDAAITRMHVIEQELGSRGLALYPYQRDGVRWLSHRKCAALLDAPGLGKTVQALVSAPEGAPILVVAPAAVKGTWRRETRRWRPDLGWPMVLSGRSSFRWPIHGDIVVTNYDILPKPQNIGTEDKPRYALPEWLPQPHPGTVVIYDECAALKNPKTRRTVSARLISHAVQAAGGFVWGLTGTPLMNRPKELWYVLSVLGIAKEAYTSWNHFRGLFNPWTNEPKPEVAHRLRQVSLMRKREEVLPDLPTKTYRDVSVKIDADTRKLADELTGKLLKAGIDLSKIQSIAELVSATKNTQVSLGEISKVRAALAQAKIPKLVELVEEREAEEKALVVFSAHLAPVEALASRPGWLKITGAEEGLKRTAIVEEFASGKLKGVGCTIRAAGVGIDGLQRASHEAIFCDLDWTPAWNDQSEDRICIVEGQLVHTRRGMVPVEQIRLGDHVLTQTGAWCEVKAVSSREHRKLLTDIHYARYGTPLSTTSDHLVLVRHPAAEPVCWVEACHVLPSDFLVMPRPMGRSEDERVEAIRVPAAVRPPNVQIGRSGNAQRNGRRRPMPEMVSLDEDMLFSFGFYLAEGFASVRPGKGRFISFSGHSREVPVLERIGRRLEQLGANWTIYTRPGNGVEMRAYSADLARWFLHLFGHGAHSKSIPEGLMDLPPSQARCLLDGYLLGDGYLRGTQQEWVSMSVSLAHQIALLALRCGCAPTLRRRTDTGAWVGAFTIEGNPDNESLAAWDERYVYQPVRQVTTRFATRHNRKIRVWDIEVEDDESFVVGQATVHNCRIGQDRGVIITTLIADHMMDEKVIELLTKKRRLIDQAVNASARSTVEEQFSEDQEDQVKVKLATGPAPDLTKQQPAFLEIPNLWKLFMKVKGSGLDRPSITVQGMELKMAGRYSARYQGQVHVTNGAPFGTPQAVWYGRIAEGQFYPSRACIPEVAAKLKAWDLEPDRLARDASAYGHRTGVCCFCSTGLTDERSVTVGYGPICAERWGLPWGHAENQAVEIPLRSEA